MQWPTVPKNLLPVPASSKPKKPANDFARKVATFRQANDLAETFIVPCVCAKTDRPFLVRYERFDPNAKFRIAAVDKSSPSAGGAGANALKTLPVDKVDFTGWHCPWCLDRRSSVQCGRCHTTVCSGRVTDRYDGEYFVCRDSCGCEGLLTPSTEIHGASERSPQRHGKRAAPSSGAPKLCAPKPTFPRLNGPKK